MYLYIYVILNSFPFGKQTVLCMLVIMGHTGSDWRSPKMELHNGRNRPYATVSPIFG